jgi:hypothetical protein
MVSTIASRQCRIRVCKSRMGYDLQEASLLLGYLAMVGGFWSLSDDA